MVTAEEQAAEDRRIITPHAFTISSELLGLKLARPWRRGLAMILDLVAVALLSTLSGYLMVILAAAILWRMVAEDNFSAIVRWLLRAAAALVILVALLGVIFDREDDELISLPTELESAKSQVSLAISVAKAVKCDDLECWQPRLDDAGQFIAIQTTEPQVAKDIIQEIVTKTELELHHKDKLAQLLTEAWVRATSETVEQPIMETELSPGTVQQTLNSVEADPGQEINIRLFDGSETWGEGVRGPFSWLKGIIEELGLGFGWAACYFTLFTAWWRGQTPGKKLLRIRVLQLDNSPMSLWESFGRYGGYAAGLTTGLLGFLQIYWDPNRQAIQDKISATVVIYGDQQ